MLAALVSAKGSPGVTTTALALAASASHLLGRDRVLVMEADRSGGDLECWCGPLGEPALLGAVTEIRDPANASRLPSLAVEVVPGLSAITAPTTDVSAGAALRSATVGFAEAAALCDRMVVADLGRFASTAVREDKLLAQADLVGVVCRPTLASVEHSRDLVASLSAFTQVVVIVVGGSRPYGSEEIARSLDAHVAAVLPWDVRGVTGLVEGGLGRVWTRSSLRAATDELFRAVGRAASVDPEPAHG